MHVFENYIPNKKVKLEYGEATRMNINIKCACTKGLKPLTKRSYVLV